MKVKIKLLNENASIPFKSHDDDFCFDCVATSCEEIAPNVFKYGLGISLEMQTPSIPVYNYSIDLRSRSSIYKTGLILANGVGTVDSGYRGEVCAIFYHVVPSLPIYKVGDRVCQLKIGKTKNIEWEIVSDLTASERNSGGFGSTGK